MGGFYFASGNQKPYWRLFDQKERRQGESVECIKGIQLLHPLGNMSDVNTFFCAVRTRKTYLQIPTRLLPNRVDTEVHPRPAYHKQN